jgi:two-component system, chemotaxis family, response regulator Rcp1
MPQIERQFEILVIDDNKAEAELFRQAWAECRTVKTNVSLLHDSRAAIVYLRSAPPYEKVPKPDLVMVDYKMPVDGGIALTEIKGDPDYLNTPVIVVSGSDDPRDYFDAYQRHANCCFRKPGNFDELLSLVELIAETWLRRAILPRR